RPGGRLAAPAPDPAARVRGRRAARLRRPRRPLRRRLALGLHVRVRAPQPAGRRRLAGKRDRNQMTTTKLLPHSVLGAEISVAPEDHPFRREFRAWLAENAPGVPEPLDQDEKFELRRRWQRTLFEGGWAGPAWSEEHGGRG